VVLSEKKVPNWTEAIIYTRVAKATQLFEHDNNEKLHTREESKLDGVMKNW